MQSFFNECGRQFQSAKRWARQHPETLAIGAMAVAVVTMAILAPLAVLALVAVSALLWGAVLMAAELQDRHDRSRWNWVA